MNRSPVRVLLDDVFFTLANTGIARLWEETLRFGVKNQIFEKANVDITVLSRSGKLDDLGLKIIDFPQYDTWLPAADRELLSKVCHQFDFDIFVSTYFTCVPDKKNLMIMYDLIPEIFEFSRTSRGWLEREIGIYCADEFICISQSTKKDLKLFYPHILDHKIQVAHPGINHSNFYRRGEKDVKRFKLENNLDEYIVFVGSRYQTNDYKNAKLFFSGVNGSTQFDFDVVCVGGESLTNEERITIESKGRRIVQLSLSDEELAICLTGARTLLYPSLYEGFGIPPLESLAVGTPVVTTMRSSLPESVGNLAIEISGDNGPEILEAIQKASARDCSDFIREEGPKWASEFTWESMATALVLGLIKLNDYTWSSSDSLRHQFLGEYTHSAMKFQGLGDSK
jgi:glycosyltransferase involved in cell wall biosynthesis